MDDIFIKYLTEKIYELKIMELDFLITLTENYDNEEKLNKIEHNFLEKYKSLYVAIGQKCEKLENSNLKDKIKEICEDFLREISL
jgi:hypothetical protein